MFQYWSWYWVVVTFSALGKNKALSNKWDILVDERNMTEMRHFYEPDTHKQEH